MVYHFNIINAPLIANLLHNAFEWMRFRHNSYQDNKAIQYQESMQ